MGKMRWRIILFILGLILMGVGSLVSINDFLSFTIHDTASPSILEKQSVRTFNVELDRPTYINAGYEIVIDNELKPGNARIEVSYIEGINEVELNQSDLRNNNNIIDIILVQVMNGTERFRFMFERQLNDLRQRKIYVHNLYNMNVVIYINEEDRLKLLDTNPAWDYDYNHHNWRNNHR